MKWGVLFLVAIIVGTVGVVCGKAAAADGQVAWRDSEVKVISRAPASQEQSLCTGVNQDIHLKGRDYTNKACVHGVGGETRIAFYVNGQGFKVTAIAFPTDIDFYDIRGLCVGAVRCAYASKTDTFAMPIGYLGYYSSMGYYGHFSEQLERFVDGGTMTPYYQFVPRASPTMVKRGSSDAAVNAFAFSDNGRWAIAEVISYGFVRVDMITGQARRIMAPGADYGYGFDPSYELAISDTGNEVAAVGRNVGIDIFEMDSQCGDTLTDTSEKYFSREVNPCRGASINRFQLFPQFISASYPRFNTSGTKLGVTVATQNRSNERAILSATSIAPGWSPKLISLGDSFTSGEGETDDIHYLVGTNTNIHQCHVSDRSYPFLIGKEWDAEVKSVACSGAGTNDIVGSGWYKGQGDRTKSLSDNERKGLEGTSLQKFQPGVLRQLDFITTYMPGVVSVSIGGNDAGLMDKLRACLGIDVCEWVKDAGKRQATAEEIKAIYNKVRRVINDIRGASPASRIILVGYPRVVNEVENAPCSALLGVLLKPEERRFMDESIKLLNTVLESAARSEGITYVYIQDAFVGHRLCDTSPDAMNDIRWGTEAAPIQTLPQLKVIGSESFHPTPLGHNFISQAILRTFPQIPQQVDCNNCYSTTLPEESDYWKSEGTPTAQTLRQLKAAIVPAHTYRAGDTLSIATSPFIFRKGSTVTAELHSQTKQLGIIQADATGLVSVAVELPKDVGEGYHALHLFGTSWSGEAIDVYQVIEVGSEIREVSSANTTSLGNVISHEMVSPDLSTDSIVMGQTKNLSAIPPAANVYGNVLGSSSVLFHMPLKTMHQGALPSNVQEMRAINPVGIVSAFVFGAMGVTGLLITLFIRRRHDTGKRV